MTCAEFEQELQARLDRRAAADEGLLSLEAHARECSACRERQEAFRILAEAVGPWRGSVPDVDLTEAILARLAGGAGVGSRLPLAPEASDDLLATEASEPTPARKDSIRSLRSARRILWGTVAALSTLWLASTVIPWGWGEKGAPRLAQSGKSAARTAKVATSRRPRAGSQTPMMATAGRLTRTAAGALGEFASLVVPPKEGSSGSSRVGPVRTAPQHTEAAHAEQSPPGEGWIDQWENSLEPLGKSVEDTFDFLWYAGQTDDGSRT